MFALVVALGGCGMGIGMYGPGNLHATRTVPTTRGPSATDPVTHEVHPGTVYPGYDYDTGEGGLGGIVNIKLGQTYATYPGRDTAWGTGYEISFDLFGAGEYFGAGLTFGYAGNEASYKDFDYKYSGWLTGVIAMFAPLPGYFYLHGGASYMYSASIRKEFEHDIPPPAIDADGYRLFGGINIVVPGTKDTGHDAFLRIEGFVSDTEDVVIDGMKTSYATGGILGELVIMAY